jgi:hypothetical protein
MRYHFTNCLYQRHNSLQTIHKFTFVDILVGELGLIDLTPSRCGCIATGLLVGSGSTLLPHFHISIVP